MHHPRHPFLTSATAVALLVLAVALAPPSAGYSRGRVAFILQGKEITESSGVVASSRRDDVWFTHNDSGDGPRFFALDRSGCTVATFNVAGVDVDAFKAGHDVEDIARGPHAGRSSLWLADIGDNGYARSDIAVLRVDEPDVAAPGGACTTGPTHAVAATTYRLAYPDTPHDAETLLADPRDGRLYIVTKTPIGQSSVYAAPAVLRADAVNTLELVGSVVFAVSTTYDRDPAEEVAKLLDPERAPYTQPGFDLAGRFMAVGGDVAPDRSRVVIRTYTDAYEWPIAAGASLPDALAQAPTAFPLVYERQGEAIAFTRDSRSLLTTCEDVGCPAHIYGP